MPSQKQTNCLDVMIHSRTHKSKGIVIQILAQRSRDLLAEHPTDTDGLIVIAGSASKRDERAFLLFS